MRRNQSSLMFDVAFLALLVLCFVCIVVIAGDAQRYLYHIICLNIAFLIAVAAHFLTVKTGLLLNILFVFGYGTYILYQALVVGIGVEPAHYFWLLMTPALTLTTGVLTEASKRLQQENELLHSRNAEFSTMDADTSLKNIRAYKGDAETFMALSVRYRIPITLLVMNVKYWQELSRITRGSQVADMIRDLSRLNEASIRMNDSLYMLSTEPPSWGLLLFTDRPGAAIVMNRIKERLGSKEFAEKYEVELDLRFGLAPFHPETPVSPLELLAQAKKNMEYDV